MNDLDAQIAAVLALDEKRTPGEWVACPPESNHSKGKMRVRTYTPALGSSNICTVPATDAAFIAAAPLMASIIRQLAAERAADAADARRYRAFRALPTHRREWLAHGVTPELFDCNVDALLSYNTAITSAGGTTDE